MAPCCPLVTSVEDVDRALVDHHDDVIVLQVLDGVIERLASDHDA